MSPLEPGTVTVDMTTPPLAASNNALPPPDKFRKDPSASELTPTVTDTLPAADPDPDSRVMSPLVPTGLFPEYTLNDPEDPMDESPEETFTPPVEEEEDEEDKTTSPVFPELLRPDDTLIAPLRLEILGPLDTSISPPKSSPMLFFPPRIETSPP